MENKFKVLNSNNKKWNTGTHLGLRTFTGDLFKGTGWGHDLFYRELDRPLYLELTETFPVEKLKYQGAVESLTQMVEKSPGPIVRDNVEISSDNWINFELDHDTISRVRQNNVLVSFVGLNEQVVDGQKLVDQKQLELIQNMAKAMQLKNDEYSIISLETKYLELENIEKIDPLNDSGLKNILSEIYSTKPKVIYSLGANITNFFLKRREKLSVLHGNVVEIRFRAPNKELVFSTLVMPLFHPELLIINPNMKRTTWIDLQKSLPLIGKI